ncbi:lipid transferase CIDEB [Alligator mississippiensis]|uniref:Cell death activator CIDE-B n=1 Tax=Alligator mississippiensis TaxID=8496 RepID=A0A151NW82_ALLMI|nr:lipid transferase CIDEB [Alligator mississippiensis]KYO40685.1 cell death activator CIDE-B [Alligator mississippiensis]
MEYVSALAPASLLRSVSSAGTELSRRVLAPRATAPRPFRLCDHRHGARKGLMAASLPELRCKAQEALQVSGPASLVLEEDGTAVESEDFFQSLPDNTGIMLLAHRQSWSPPKGGSRGLSRGREKQGGDIARVTFDMYKLHPRDLFGSLSITATFYGLYSMSCDFTCLGPKKVLREVLKVISAVMQGMGRLLLGASNYIRRLLDGSETWYQPARLQACN